MWTWPARGWRGRAPGGTRPHRERVAEGVDPFGARSVDGAEVDPFAVEARDGGHLASAQPYGALGDDVEHRLEIGRRAGR